MRPARRRVEMRCGARRRRTVRPARRANVPFAFDQPPEYHAHSTPLPSRRSPIVEPSRAAARRVRLSNGGGGLQRVHDEVAAQDAGQDAAPHATVERGVAQRQRRRRHVLRRLHQRHSVRVDDRVQVGPAVRARVSGDTVSRATINALVIQRTIRRRPPGRIGRRCSTSDARRAVQVSGTRGRRCVSYTPIAKPPGVAARDVAVLAPVIDLVLLLVQDGGRDPACRPPTSPSPARAPLPSGSAGPGTRLAAGAMNVSTTKGVFGNGCRTTSPRCDAVHVAASAGDARLQRRFAPDSSTAGRVGRPAPCGENQRDRDRRRPPSHRTGCRSCGSLRRSPPDG